ncbi:DsbA family protein [Pontibaca methylaminivorans]|uniref:Protein-disulfide isomerase n=1 Tax=Pontibaca methylaminivorans TaxID=515897 RepID=A0A1R3WWV0_9RHOB|nr:DsbA family protein [Pontibaca methylaminivorans]SIT82165.1 Protein-disulfide isomerase [Pontibaca methylaminivorans]
MKRMTAVIVTGALLALGGYLALSPKAGEEPALIGAAMAQEEAAESEAGATAAEDPATEETAADQAQEETAAGDSSAQIHEMVLGAEDAPVEVIEYASYTCPHCAAFTQGPFKQIKENYIDTGKVRWIHREVYFDRFGLWASMVARCGGEDKFFGINDLIFEKQDEWVPAPGPDEVMNAFAVDQLRKIGRVAGLDDAQLEACLQDGDKAQALVEWYDDNRDRDEIESTPSFVVNGTLVSNQSYEDFARLLDSELEKAGE